MALFSAGSSLTYHLGSCVKFGKNLSSFHTSSCGVPRGPVLGPVLFVMYTTPLSTRISSCSLYADDTQLFFSFSPLNFDSSISHLQNALQQISSWKTANLLTLNSSKTPSKTEFLLIGLKNQLAKIHNSSLDTSNSARNLGFIIDEHLTFSDLITSPKPVTLTFVNFAVSGLTSIIIGGQRYSFDPTLTLGIR